MRALLRAFTPALAALRAAVPGLLVAVALAAVARGMAAQLAAGAAGLPKFPLSPVMCAVALGMLWRNTIGVPAWATSGLNWAMHRLLRVGIALVGLRLTRGAPPLSHSPHCRWRSPVWWWRWPRASPSRGC